MQSEIEETVADLHRLFTDLNRLATRARLRKRLHADAHALTPTDTWLLAHLNKAGPLRLSALAQWQDVDPSTMTVQVKRLERAGLVKRETDPSDRRAHLVRLTGEGLEVCAGIKDAATAFFTDALAGWTATERRQLIASLTQLSLAIEAGLGTPARGDSSQRA